MENYYEVLQLPITATFDQIKQQYRALALKYHPDKINQNAEAEDRASERFLLIQKAWEVLSDNDQRKEYDLELKSIKSVGSFAECLQVQELEEYQANCWRKECRCGEYFHIYMEDWNGNEAVVPCDGCSLYLKVLKKID